MRPSGFKHSEETKAKIAQAMAGKSQTQEHKAAIGESLRKAHAARREKHSKSNP
jgi:hypothetical protein